MKKVEKLTDQLY